MRIQFERTGGFAGMRLAVELTEDDLSEDELKALQTALQQADFFTLPRKSTGGGQPDRFIYKITVEIETSSHTVEMGEGDIPEKVQPLIQQLNLLARQHR